MSKVTIGREPWQILFGDDPVMKPMPNFFTCRLAEPSEGAKYRYEKCAGKSGGKCIDFVYQIQGGKSKLQSMRYPKNAGWTRASAKGHCGKHNGKFE